MEYTLCLSEKVFIENMRSDRELLEHMFICYDGETYIITEVSEQEGVTVVKAMEVLTTHSYHGPSYDWTTRLSIGYVELNLTKARPFMNIMSCNVVLYSISEFYEACDSGEASLENGYSDELLVEGRIVSDEVTMFDLLSGDQQALLEFENAYPSVKVVWHKN